MTAGELEGLGSPASKSGGGVIAPLSPLLLPGERLLEQESLLLPSVHKKFHMYASEISQATNIQLHQDDICTLGYRTLDLK